MCTDSSMASWVADLLFTCFLRVFWVGASNSSYISLRWSASQGDRLSVTGCTALGGIINLGVGKTIGGYNLGGVTTLGGVTVGDITGVASGVGLGGWKSRWGLDVLHGTSNPPVCGSATCTFQLWMGVEWGVPRWVLLNRLCLSLIEDGPYALQLF